MDNLSHLHLVFKFTCKGLKYSYIRQFLPQKTKPIIMALYIAPKATFGTLP